MRIAVEFKDIQLNTDLQLMAGEVKTTYDPEWKNVLDVNEAIGDVNEVADAVSDLYNNIKEFLNNYKGTEEDKKKAGEFEKELNENIQQLVNNPSITPEDKNKLIQSQKDNKEHFEALKTGKDDCGGKEKSEGNGPNGADYYNLDLEVKFDCHTKPIKEHTEKVEKINALFIDKDFILKEDGYFLTPSNKLIKLEKGTQITFYCNPPQEHQNYVLHGFKTPDGFTWENSTNYSSGNKNFVGYYKVKKDKNEWEKDGSGNRILYSDVNYKYKGSGKYPLFKVLYISQENKNAEYKIYKGEADISSGQIASNINFEGKIDAVSDKSNLNLVLTIKSNGCTPIVVDKGNFVVEIEDSQKRYKVKVFKNNDGKFSTEFTLLNKSKKGLSDKVKNDIIAQTESLMNEKLQKMGGLEGFEKGFKDESGFYVADMTGKQWLETIGNLSTNVWKNATLPENYWNEDNKGFKDSTVRMPALFTGVSDGAIDLVSDYPQLVKLGYDVATKEEVRTGIWEGIKTISVDKIISFAEGAVKEKLEKYNSNKPYEKNHELGKDGVGVVKMVATGGLIVGIKDVGEKFSKKAVKKIFKDTKELVADIVAKRRNIRINIIELADSKEMARLFAKKIDIKDADFEDWFKNSFKTTEKGTINFQAHHVIPVEILENNKDFNELLFRLQGKADFDFNGIDNGIMLQAKSISLDVAGHAKHKAYTDALDVKITEICSNAKIDDLDKLNKIKDLVSSAKEKLKTEVLLGNKDVNDIVKF